MKRKMEQQATNKDSDQTVKAPEKDSTETEKLIPTPVVVTENTASETVEMVVTPDAEKKKDGDVKLEEATEKSSGKSSDSSSSRLSDTRVKETKKEIGPAISFKVIYNGKKYDMNMPSSNSILELKEALSPIIDVMPAMQKVMIKGLASNDKTLAELGVTKMSKVLVVGSKLDDIVNVNLGKPSTSSSKSSTSSSISKKEPLCTQKLHKKIIDKGVPDDVHPGIKGTKEALPRVPLSGMVNKTGDKVRLTFKLELDQIWIGTKQRTEKVNMNSIRSVVSEPITGHEEYHIMGFQLGTTEASRYWVYWVPCQYVSAIRSVVLGSSW